MAGNPLNVVIFTSVPPRQVARIMARIRRDAPQAQVVGVLYERRPPKTLQQRIATWRKKMRRPIYWLYVLHRISAAVNRKLSSLLDSGIRFIHAAPKQPNGTPHYPLGRFGGACQAQWAPIFISPHIHSPQGPRFVRPLQPPLCLVFGPRSLKP